MSYNAILFKTHFCVLEGELIARWVEACSAQMKARLSRMISHSVSAVASLSTEGTLIGKQDFAASQDQKGCAQTQALRFGQSRWRDRPW